MLNSENIQTAAFFALVLVFEILERVRPEREPKNQLKQVLWRSNA